MGRPLRIYRAKIFKQASPKLPSVPWVVKCGCGAKIRVNTWDRAWFSLRIHRIEEH